MTRSLQRFSAISPLRLRLASTLCLVGLLGLPVAAGQLPPGLLERAEQDDVDAQTELGSRYYTGRGVEQDDAAAVRWIRRAAEQGHAPAEYNLGLLYFRSRGVRGDDVQAAEWYRRAAEQAYPPAQAGLGYMYAYGTGVEEDLVLASMWLELAWNGARDDFARRLYAQQLDELAERMTADQRDESQRLAQSWRPATGR